MRSLGIILLLVGAVTGLYALFLFETSVAGVGYRVNNLGLMQDRQNLLIGACTLTVVGAMFAIFSPKANPHERVADSFPPNLQGATYGASEADINAMRDAIERDNLYDIRAVLQGSKVKAYGELNTGRGFLQFAVRSERPNAIAELLAHGASPDAKDSSGQTAADIATTIGSSLLSDLVGAHNAIGGQPDVFTTAVIQSDGLVERLEKLASLHASGVLTDIEFAVAKERALGGGSQSAASI